MFRLCMAIPMFLLTVFLFLLGMFIDVELRCLSLFEDCNE